MRKIYLTKSILSAITLLLFFFNSAIGQITQVAGSPQSNNTTGTTLTINKPSGLAIGDVMISNIVQSDNNGNTLNDATLSGWAEIDGRDIGTNGSDHWRGTLLFKVATAADVSASSFGFTVDNDAEDGSVGAIVAFRGVDVTGGFSEVGAANSGPFDVDPGIINLTNAGSATASAITTSTANAAVIMFGMLSNNANFSAWQIATGPLSLTELYDVPNNTGLDNGIGAAWAVKAAAGSTGSGTANLTSSIRNGGILIALKALPLIPTITSFTPNNGCANTTSVVITGTNFTGATAVTFGGTAAASFTVNTATQITAIPAAGTSGNISVTTPGGTGTSGSNFTVNSLPTVVSVSGGGTFCGSTTLTASNGSSGTIYFQGTTSGGTSTATASTSESVSASGTYYFRAWSGSCWGPEGSAVVTINASPIITTHPSTSTQSVCQNGAATSLSVTATGAGLGYQWYSNTVASNSGGSLIATATLANYTPLTTATGTLYYYCIVSGTCAPAVTSNVSGAITVKDLPVAGTVTGANSVCVGGSITLSSNPTGTGPFTYTWSSSNTGLATITNAGNLTGVAAGTPQINYTVTQANGCSATSPNFAVTVSKPVAGAITGLTKVCIGNTINLTAAGSGNAPLTYTWASTNTAVATVSGTGVVSGVANGTSSITYTVTDAYGCSTTSAGFTVTVSKPIANAITGATSVCIGSTIAMTSNASGTATLTYTWASSNSAVATVSATGVVTGVAAGTANITYTVTDGNSCPTTSPVRTITVNAKPVAGAITGGATVCQAGTTNLSANASGASPFTYTWASSNNGVASVNSSGVVSGVSIGSANISYTVTDVNGCSATSATFVMSVTQPTAGAITHATGLSVVCEANTLPLNSNATGTGILTFTWASTNNLKATVNNSGVVSGISAGSANITYTVTDGNGCQATSAAYGITVTDMPLINVSATPTTICLGSPVKFSADAGYVAYTFRVNGLTVQNGPLSDYNTTSITAGDVVTVEVYANNCSSIYNLPTITVNPLPVPALSANKTTICPGEIVTFTAGGGTNYAFKVNGSGVQSGASNIYTTSGLTNGASVTVDVTNSNNCTITSPAIGITVNAVPTGTLTASKTTICAGENITFTATGGTSYQFKVNGSIAQAFGASNTFSSTALADLSVVTVDVTNAFGCTVTYSPGLLISVNPLPTIIVTPASSSICIGLGTTLTASGANTYSWSPATGLSATTGATVTANPVTTTTYTVTGTNTNGCVNSTTVTVMVNPLPTIAVTPASGSICNGLSTSLTASGATTYTWSPATGLSATTGNTVTANPTSTTTYTVTGTNSNGCINTVTVTVTVNPLPTITVTPASAMICIGSSTSLTASGATSYSWSPATGLSATTGATVTANPTSTTTYTITGTNGNGCINTTTVTITVNPLPAITVTPASATICNGLSTSLTAGGAVTYSWSPATGLSATTGTTVTANPASTTTYTVTGTDANGCINSTTVTVTVNPLPNITVAPASAAICFGGSTSMTASGANTYSWSPATGLSATTGTTVTANPASTTTYTVTGTNSNGCINTTTVTITVNPLPTISVTPASASICIGSSTTLTAGGATTYSWSPSTGLSATTGATVTANPTTTTTYTVTGTNSNGCVNTTTVTVTVNPLPTISVTPASASICIGSSTMLSASGAISYTWSPAAGLSSTTGSGVTANPVSTTTYTVTGTNSNGCVNTTTVTVTVNPLPTISVTPASATICIGENTSLTASGANSYSWSPSTGLSATTGATVTANPTTTTTYIVTGTNSNGCVNTSTVTITVNPLPTITVTPSSATICIGSNTLLTASGATSYSWSPATGLSSTTGASVTANPAATTTYTVTGTNSNGCINTTTVTVTVNPLPVITVTPASATICNGLSTTLTASGATTYSWSPATGLSATTGSTVTANPISTTTYTVTGTDANGCVNSTTVTVTVNPLPTIAVTPSSASICIGLNTLLTASGASIYSWSPATGLSATTGSVVTANPTSTTTYTVTGTDVNGCINSTNITVTVNALPNITVTPASATICNGSSTSLTAGGATTYSWSPAMGLSATTGANVTANPTTTTTYTVTGINSNGCINTSTVTITVNPLPTITAIPAAATICNGLSTTITASGAVSYSWSPATGLSSTTGATVTANPTSTTTYTISGTDANGCVNTTTATVTVNPSPLPSITGKNPICLGDVETYTTQAGQTNYTWIVNGGTVTPGTGGTGDATIEVTWTSAGSKTINVNYTNSYGCTANTFSTFSTAPTTAPPTILSGVPVACINSTGNVYTTESGKTDYDWVVNGGNITSGSGTNSITVTWNTAGSRTVTINYSIIGGCNAATPTIYPVTVNPLTGATSFTSGSITVCQNAIDETYTAIANNSTSIAYSVSPGTAGVINSATGLMNWDAAFSGPATITATSTGLCGTTSANAVVTVNPSTGATSFTAGATTVCQNAVDETYTATAANSTSIIYSVSPAAAGVINASTGLMNWDAAFSGSATITATSTGLCGTTSANRLVTVNPSTGVTSFTAGATTVCQNAMDETYTATAANSTSITYSVLPAGAGVINSGTGSMNWNAAFSGIATITATSTGLCGTTTASRSVTVNPSTGATSFTAGATTVCQNAVDETYTTTAANSTSVAYSVIPSTAGIINPATGLMNWDAAFSGTALIIASSTGLCGTTSASRSVTVNPSTGITNFTAGATTVCQDAADETYTATAANSTSRVYSVSPGAAGVINAGTGSMNWDAAFSGTATITATSTGLCGTTTANRTVTVNPSTGATSFTAGATTVCQDAVDETYTATAANSTSIVYSVLPAAAGVINAGTGVMNWSASFSGIATITATSTGLCGTTTASRTVTINPSTGATGFTAGATTVCQDAVNETYTATAANSTTITYSVLPVSAGVINAGTGSMNWDAAFSGTATITATSTGLCGTTTANRTVTVNPSTGATSFTAGATTVCQDAVDETYTVTAANSTSRVYSVLPAAAGVINSASGVMNWAAAFSGTATISATSTGLCGSTTASRTVTVNPSTGATSFTAGATTVCQNANDETYTATAANSTSIVYSVLPAAAGIINAASGVMNWDAAFSGIATITATSTGLCGTTTANRIVTVNPSTGTTSFTAGATTVCQNAADETYTATAANSTSKVYSVSPAAAGIINSSTGVMNWDAAFSGTATITATSTGLCGTTIANRLVTVNPSTGATTFTAGSIAVCQNAADETYTATAANSTSIAYTVSPAAAGVINISTGVMNWDVAFTGTATITATSTGLCGTTNANRLVTVNAPPVAPTVTPSTATICQNSIQPLSAGPTTTNSTVTFSSGTINSGIPNNSATGVASSIAIAGIPAGAVVNSVSVNFNITHDYDSDLRINLKAPNSNVLNLVNQKGGSGDNFTNTTVSSSGVTIFTTAASAAPFNGTFKADAVNAIAGATTGGGNTSNVTTFASLYGTPNGNWVLSARDASNANSSTNGSIISWSITIDYSVTVPTLVTWSPVTDLYTDAGATTAYTGTSISTVYAKPSTAGTKVYTATATNAAGCTSSTNATLTVNPVPVVTILADYCLVPGRVRLTASSTPSAATYVWSTGATGSYTDVDIAEYYDVTATFATGCTSTASINIAVELVTNGDFSAGNTGFSTEYTNNQAFYDGTGTSGLWPEGYYAVNTSAFSPSNGTGYHPYFHGKDHTTGNGNFLMINGSATLIGSPARLRTIWQQTISVLPNTNYYFSAYGMNLNPSLPAQLQFEVNGVAVGTIADLNVAAKPTSEAEVGLSNWVRFYSNPNWNSGSNTTAVIRIINLNTNAGGNDFGLDDISFSTLSPFITLISAAGTDGQTVCVNSPINTILYSIGSGSQGPTVTGLPPGVTAVFNGVNVSITGTPTVAGSYAYNITSAGNCNPVTATGTITVQAQNINLTSGSSVQTSCKNAAIAPIIYTISGAASNAAITGLPAGVNMVKAGNVFTISGTPTVAGVYNYSITTSGACSPVIVIGSITVQEQTIALLSGSSAQTLCINNAITNIVYTVGGAATSAVISGSLPTGVTGTFNSGLFFISGTPTQAGTFNYTVTTSGTCAAATAQLSGSIIVNPNAAGGILTSVSICVGASGSLTLSGYSGTIQNWESSINSGSTWTNIANTTVSQSYTNVTVPTMYRVKVSNGCNTTYSTIATLGIHNLWTGSVSIDWQTGANWSDGLIPTSTCPDVIIPAGTPYSPLLGSGTASINNVIIYPGASLKVSGGILQIAGTITNNGSFDVRNGTLDFNGASSQNVSGNMFVTNTIKNLTISNGSASGLTISNTSGNPFNITGTLAFGNINNATLNTGDNVVLISNASGTARVADITNNGLNSGNKFNGFVTVERYFPARRAWRLFTAPLTSTGSIFDNWQNGGVYAPGKGTYVSGLNAVSPTGANGLDWSNFNNSSLKVGLSFTPVSNTHTAGLSMNIANNSDNIPYFIFVRGDRDMNNTIFPNSNNTTLSSRGKLQTGTQTYPGNSLAGGYTMVGNPFASPVDMGKIVRTNVYNRYTVWDPYINTEQGGYIVFEDTNNDGNYETITPNYTTLTQHLQSGQAFFVQTIAAGPSSVVFQESSKSSSNNLVAFRPTGQQPSLRVNFYHLNENNNTVLLDGVLTQFDESFNMAVDGQDVLKSANVKENIAVQQLTKTLTVDRRPVPVSADTIFLQISRTTERNYRLAFEPSNFEGPLTAFLEDIYTHTQTPLNLMANSVYDFTVNGQAASAAANRFRIVFKQAAVLPVTYKSVKAYQKAADIEVDWTVENEINISRYEVEKSADGVSFAKVNTTAASGANRTSTTYTWLDTNPLDGNNFYRVRSISKDGKFEYSQVVVVKMGKNASGIRIYPNPVTDGIIGAEFKNMAGGIYKVRLLNSQGQTILSKTINHATGTSMETIRPDYKLIAGIYQLEITAPGKEINMVKVIVK